MAQGKFSKPRPDREEDRQIEEAFRQVTGQPPLPKQEPAPSPFPETEDIPLFPEAEGPEDIPLFPEEASGDLPLFPEDPVPAPPAPPVPPTPPAPPAEPEQPGFAQKLEVLYAGALEFFTKNRMVVLISMCAVALLLIIGLAAAIFVSTSDPYDKKILNNVFIAGVNVGGMTKSQATSAVDQAGRSLLAQDMVIELAGASLTLEADQVGASLDAKGAVDEAYAYGRSGTQAERDDAYQSSFTDSHVIDLTNYLELNTRYIRQTLEGYATNSGTLTQTSYGLEGDQPELATDKYNENKPCQTLVITMGTPGVSFDADTVYAQVLSAYSQLTFTVTMEQTQSVTEPRAIDLTAIYTEFYIAPVDAGYNPSTYEAIPGSYGYEFDIEAARKLVEAAEYGQEIRIPMQVIEPEVVDGTLFQDVLGQCQTAHTNNSNRNTNLRLACEALNGLVLNPGETFSFNDTLGQRTTAKGYKSAPGYVGDELVDTVGGGICQVSSTLYWCTLLSDLATVSRTNHGFPVSYIDYGLDATVSWSSPDFKFRNSTAYPVKIEAEVSGGYVKIRILGTDQRDYYVRMEYEITNTYQPETEYVDFPYNNAEGYLDGDVLQEGVTGYYVKTYKVTYDAQTNQRLSREFAANSQYKTVNKLVARVEPEPTTAPTTEPTTPPTTTPPETTAPPQTETTAPTETTEPPQTSSEPQESQESAEQTPSESAQPSEEAAA